MQEKNLSLSLMRGFAILAAFSEEQPLLGITELATKLHLKKSTVHRYVNTLKALGYLEQDEQTKKLRLGIRVVDLGVALLGGMELRQIALPHLEDLASELGYTVNMSVLDETEIVYIERVRTNKILNLDLHIGSRLPAYCTSMGKVLLAYLPPEELATRVHQLNPVRLGPNTIIDKEELLQELQRVRERGYAINNEELAQGLRSLAAPIRSGRGEVIAAINIAVHTSMIALSETENTLASRLIATADKISRKLGYRGSRAANRLSRADES